MSPRVIAYKAAMLCFPILLSLSLPAEAIETSISGMIIRAEELRMEGRAKTVILNGDVQIIFQSQHLSADQALVNRETKELIATGNVVIITPEATISGEKVRLNYETNLGTIYNGYVEAGQVLFEGKEINKVGEKSYDVKEGVYTACDTCPPAWAFSGARIEAEIGGYAKIRYPLFEIAGFPVIWLPYLVLPLKSSRQTGLLIPTFEHSRSGGTAFGQSFFWAMSRSSDSTWTLKNYELRGLKGIVNYRYLLSRESYGSFDAEWINDRAFGRSNRLNRFRSTEDQNDPVKRWFVDYDHHYELPNGYVQRTNLKFVSDLQYPTDFSTEVGTYGDPALENRISLSKNTKTIHSHIETAYNINLLQADPLAHNEDAVHRFPEINISGAEQHLGETGLLYHYNINYVNYARGSFGYDDLSMDADTGQYYVSNDCNQPGYQSGREGNPDCQVVRDGVYNPGNPNNNFAGADLIRSGQRIDMQPTLSYPINLGEALDILPSVSYRETHYHFAVDDNPVNVRKYLRASVSARSTLSRVFGDLDDTTAERYKHEMQPEILVTTVPWIDQPKHPFFFTGEQSEIPFFRRENISNEDLRGENRVQFDANDRLYDRELVTLALTNKLIQKYWDNEEAVYRQLVRLRLAQNYDAYQARISDDPSKGWQDLQIDLDARFDQFQTNTLIRYFPQSEVSDVRSRIRVNNKKNDFFQVEWTKRYNFETNNDDSAILGTNDYRLSAGVTGRYLDLIGLVVYDAEWEDTVRRDPIKSWGLISRLKAPGNCWHITSTLVQPTGGDTEFQVGFEFKFDGQTFTGLDPNALTLQSF